MQKLHKIAFADLLAVMLGGFFFFFVMTFAFFTVATAGQGYLSEAFMVIYMCAVELLASVVGTIPKPLYVALFNGLAGALLVPILLSIWRTMSKLPPDASRGWKRDVAIMCACLVMLPGIPLLFRRCTFPIISDGKRVAVAKRAFIPLADMQITTGDKKVFGLWDGFIEHPVLIHSLDDGRRFLCVFDYDVENLVFVVDTTGSFSNSPASFKWLEFVVHDTTALVRPPTQSEFQTTSAWLTGLDDREFKSASLPFRDFGFYRHYVEKKEMLAILQ